MMIGLSNAVAPVLPHLPAIAGSAGVALGASWALLGRRSAILACQTLGSLAFALHFLLIGSSTGMLMCLIGAAQSVAAWRVPQRGAALMTFYAATVAVAAAVTGATWHGVPSLCSAFGVAMATIGRLQRDGQRMRQAFGVGTVAWAVHNFLVGSVFGNVSDALTMGTILVGLWRYRAPRPRHRLAIAARAAPTFGA